MSAFPKTLHHPNHTPGTVTRLGDGPKPAYQGTPAKFPPVTVYNEAQEGQHRAMGYLEFGEQKMTKEFQEFPMWLHAEGKEPVLARDASHATQLVAQGYKITQTGRPPANAIPEDYDPKEWPKWVNGVLMQDPATPAPSIVEYPKWIKVKDKDVLVASKEEEESHFGPPSAETLLAKAEAELADATLQLEAAEARHEKATRALSALQEKKPVLPLVKPKAIAQASA